MLCGLELPTHPDLLRGLEGNEDAGVFRISENQAFVQTVDVLTPMIDDPFAFGRIAAANALSDVYAMGARPITALNIVCFPAKQLGVETLGAIIEGGLDAIKEAGAVLLGGHSVENEQPIYGLAVTGLVDPRALMTNDGLTPGQRIVLTKAVGTGFIANALKTGKAPENSIDAMVASMSRLNGRAAELAAAAGVMAASDVTGFGLVGHLVEMARASRCRIRLHTDAVPFLVGAVELAAAGPLAGGSLANFEFFETWTTSDDAVAPPAVSMVFDAQTSGGLLLGADADVAERLASDLHDEDGVSAVVAEVVSSDPEGAVEIAR